MSDFIDTHAVDEFQYALGITCEYQDTHDPAPYTLEEIKEMSGRIKNAIHAD